MNALQIMSPRVDPINWEAIESEWLKLPPLYKVFHDIYNIDTIRDLNHFTIKGKYGWLDSFGEYTYKHQKSIVLDTIFKVDELKIMFERVMDMEDDIDIEVFQRNVIPIAYDPTGCLLMLGIGPENLDKIYYYIRDFEERLFLQADNVFLFFRDYEIEIKEVRLSGVPIQRLYRNWGEDFWRVRED